MHLGGDEDEEVRLIQSSSDQPTSLSSSATVSIVQSKEVKEVKEETSNKEQRTVVVIGSGDDAKEEARPVNIIENPLSETIRSTLSSESKEESMVMKTASSSYSESTREVVTKKTSVMETVEAASVQQSQEASETFTNKSSTETFSEQKSSAKSEFSSAQQMVINSISDLKISTEEVESKEGRSLAAVSTSGEVQETNTEKSSAVADMISEFMEEDSGITSSSREVKSDVSTSMTDSKLLEGKREEINELMTSSSSKSSTSATTMESSSFSSSTVQESSSSKVTSGNLETLMSEKMEEMGAMTASSMQSMASSSSSSSSSTTSVVQETSSTSGVHLEGRMEEVSSTSSTSQQRVESSSFTSTVEESTSSSTASSLLKAEQLEALMGRATEEMGATSSSSVEQSSSSSLSSSVVQSSSMQGADGEKVVSTSSLQVKQILASVKSPSSFPPFQTAANTASAVKTVDGEEVERTEEGVAMREELVGKVVEKVDGKVESQEARLVEMEGERREGGEVVQHRREEQFTEMENSVTKVDPPVDLIDKEKEDEQRHSQNLEGDLLEDEKNCKDEEEDEDLPPPPPSMVDDFPPPPPTDSSPPPPIQEDEDDDLPPPEVPTEEDLLPPPVRDLSPPPPNQDQLPGEDNEAQPAPPSSLNLLPEAQSVPSSLPASSNSSVPTSTSSASYLALVSPTGFAPRPDETEARKAFTTRYLDSIFSEHGCQLKHLLSSLLGGQENEEKENQSPSSSEDEGDSQAAR